MSARKIEDILKHLDNATDLAIEAIREDSKLSQSEQDAVIDSFRVRNSDLKKHTLSEVNEIYRESEPKPLHVHEHDIRRYSVGKVHAMGAKIVADKIFKEMKAFLFICDAQVEARPISQDEMRELLRICVSKIDIFK